MAELLRPGSVLPLVTDPSLIPEDAFITFVDKSEPNPANQDKRALIPVWREKLGNGGSTARRTPFSDVRNSDTAIISTESRLKYNAGSGDITPTLPTPENGRELWIYNVGTANNVIVTNLINYGGEVVDEEIVFPKGSPLALIGDGTNWLFA